MPRAIWQIFDTKRDVDFMKVQMGSIDVNSFKENVSKYTGINEQDLDLISFEEVKKTKGNYEVSLRNRYKTIYVIADAQDCISDFKIHERYQTQI